MIRKLFAVVFLVAAVGLASVAARAEQPPKSKTVPAPRAGSVEFVFFGDEKLTRLVIDIEVNGQSVPAIWDETFDKLFAFYDRNGDGSLDEKEASRLPSSFSLRQLVWGQSVPYAGPAMPWKQLDRDADGKVTKAELAEFYRSLGLGQALVGVGRPQATASLTAALLKSLDTDNDGKVSEAEWKGAYEALRKFDRNDDELIGPGELVPKTAYPGTLGAILLTPPSKDEKLPSELEGLPFLILPITPADTHWTSVVVARRNQDKDGKLDGKEAGLPADVFTALDTDKDGKLSPAELAAWRTVTPAPRATVRLGKRGDQAALEPPGRDFAPARLRVDVRFDEGKMPELVIGTRKQFLDRFTDADANADGFVVENEATKRNQQELKQLLLVADRDADGKLSHKELVQWLDVQDQVATGHVLLTVLDHGAGLFELLDADHDGSLSIPELRRVWEQVKGAGCINAEGKFDAAKLPRQLILTAARGHPINPLGSAKRGGPKWFVAMDRNGDGYVSRREFTGTAEVFDKLDLDKDGFISPDEAEKAKQ